MPLVTYHLSGPNTPKRYNGVTLFPKDGSFPVKDDPFRVSESNGGSVPDDKIDTLSSVLEDAFRDLREAIKKGDEKSFEMFKEYDDLTVRDYLSQKMYALAIQIALAICY